MAVWLVCGGRNFKSRTKVDRVLDRFVERFGRPDLVVHGDAKGVDTFAGWWAIDRHIENREYKADWKSHGRSAGPRRNALMLATEKPDLVVAFHGGRGTADMVRRAEGAGVKVRRVK